MGARWRWLVRLDQPVLRGPLGRLLTSVCRRRLGDPTVEVFRDDGVWVHRCGGLAFPHGERLDEKPWRVDTWPVGAERMLRRSAEYWFVEGTPEVGGTVIDVGAGRGEDLLAFARAVGPSGRVIAVEAHPTTFRRLEQFRRLNRLEQVTALHAAASDAAGELLLHEADSWKAATAVAAAPGDPSVAYRVPSLSLDALGDELGLGEVALLKINIEGAERQALRGATALLRRCCRVCVCCHDFRADRGEGEEFRTRDEAVAALRAAGLTVRPLREDRPDYWRDHVWAVRG